MGLADIRQKVHNIQRVRQILRVLVKYGFGYVVDRLDVELNIVSGRFIRFRRMKRSDVLDQPIPVRARRILEELGPTFIKLGQMLSTRPDLIPLEFCREFEKLQDEVPGFEYEKVEALIRHELRSPINEVFNNLSPEPKAAASLAQVHLAELKTGEKVVVKVQRPNIKSIITADVEILYTLARLAEKHIRESRIYNPVGIVDEFKKTIQRELEFTTEASNIEKFRRNFEKESSVYIPRVFHNLSTDRILTMERIEGIKVTDIETIEKAGLSRKQIAINGANAILKQIFIDGFFHGDPHPGNIFIIQDNTVVFLDFGIVGRIDQESKAQFANILTSITERDVSAIVEVFTVMGIIERADVRKLNLDLADLIERYYGISLEELRMEKLWGDIINVVSRNGIEIPPDLFLLVKAMITIEGVGKRLDPEFDLTVHTRPFVEKLVKQKYDPERVAKEIRRFAKELYQFTRALPKDLALILDKIKRGTLRVEFEHRGLENLTQVIDRVSNRITVSVIVAALIIGSSIVVHIDKGPMFLGLPVMGIFGFLIAGIMGLWLVVVILRSGRL